MKKFFLTLIALFAGLNLVLAQFADPAVTGANFVPNQVNTGQTSQLTVSFANTGSTTIPLASIELTISTAYSYYTSNGITAPTGAGAALFNWTYIGVVGVSDIWQGSNKVPIAAFDGGNIVLTVTGNVASTGFETTNINVQPIGNFSQFNDSQNNNNLQPQLKVNQSCPTAPVLLASTKSNVCPAITANLTSLQPAAVIGQTYEWHTVASNPNAGTVVAMPSIVLAGTYYLYSKSVCYSPASQAVTVTINVCTTPDLTISVGQPTPNPIASQQSNIPVTVTNIGTASTNGLITVVAQIPTGTTFGTFSVLNNGWSCLTSGTTATCTSSTPLASAGISIFNVPFIPTSIQVGSPLIIPAAIVTGGGELPVSIDNNTSTPVITANVAGADLLPNFTFSGTSYTLGAIKSVIININEIGGISTNGTSVEVFIPFSSGFTYSFNPIQTTATVLLTETVNNQNWTLVTKPTGLLLSSTNIVLSNGRSRIAITVTANTAGAEANITANITPSGGGETNAYNNAATLAQSIQK
ncbi:MAG: hypothetical protein V4585_04575 [Bacteroidota bacterium]